MALGPCTVKVELMPASSWVDVSGLLDLDAGVQVRPACGADPWADVEAGSASFVLDDPDGTWWPENPASAYRGLVRKGMPCRVTVTAGSTPSRRHLGRVRLIQPTLVGSVGVGTRIQFTSTDLLADLQGRTLADRMSENAAVSAATEAFSNGPDAWDSWSLEGDPTDASIPSARKGSTNSGRVVRPKSGAGNVTFSGLDGASFAGALTSPGMATFETSGAVGPVLEFPVDAQTSGQVFLAFRTDLTSLRTLAVAYDAAGTRLWRLYIDTDGILYVQDSAGGIGTSQQVVVDGAWHTLVGYLSAAAVPGAGQTMGFFLDGVGVFTAAYDTSSMRTLIVGGLMSPKSRGKQSQCFAGDVALIATIGSTQVGGLEFYAAMIADNPRFAWLRLAGYAGDLVGTVNSTVRTTSCDTVEAPTHGKSLLQAMRELARSCGGRITVTPGTGSGTAADLYLMLPEEPWPAITTSAATAFTVTLSQDDADGIMWMWGAEEAPTRYTVDGPAASATFVGDESDGRQDDSTDTWNVTEADAYAIAGGFVQSRPEGLRVEQVPVDIATAATGQALADGLLAMVPMKTVFTLAGVPSRPVGYTSTDVIAVGWEELYSMRQSTFTISTIPAAAWPRGIVASSGSEQCVIGGSGHTVTGGSAAAGTGTGGGLTVTSPGALFVTGATRFFNWGGECVQGSVSGGSSPQTLTLSARGQRGTVARVHADGEPIDIWRPFRLGMG